MLESATGLFRCGRSSRRSCAPGFSVRASNAAGPYWCRPGPPAGRSADCRTFTGCSIAWRSGPGWPPVSSGRRPSVTPTARLGCKRSTAALPSRSTPWPGSWAMGPTRWSSGSTRTWATSGTARRSSSTASSSTSTGSAIGCSGWGFEGRLSLGRTLRPRVKPKRKTPTARKCYRGKSFQRAGDRTRTGDVQLGKLAFYH